MNAGTAGREAEGTAKRVSDSAWFGVLVMAGLVAVGIVHCLIGVLALQMAWTGSPDKQADQKGALSAIASNPVGGVLLWIVAIALIGLVLWKLTQAWWGYGYVPKKSKRVRKRIGAGGAAVMYLVLAITAIRFSVGDSGKSSDQQQQTRVGELLSKPFGQVVAVVVAAAVVGYGIVLIKRGVSASFLDDYEGHPSDAVKRFGQVGFIAKGIGVGLIGVLLGWAAWSYDPKKAAGLDGSLRLVKEQTAGPIMLTLIAAGLIAYGLYCFGWSRHARR
ncbi:DUF1206 domain-containing protein [Cumulibacter manganitolerans]|uniref:DUF1206 domain-containing protein n=1 Tax=Cumulibacter manganitolerans TaxID=1884992 RepID=UPI001295F45A|nr:DUF1206 domain-containing protein [Cumulibacter manganitolerans]